MFLLEPQPSSSMQGGRLNTLMSGGSEVPRTELVSCDVNHGHCPQLAPGRALASPSVEEEADTSC